jgi:hypothetical protein
MCFEIARQQTPWKVRKVYKAVTRLRRSIYAQSNMALPLSYGVGDVVEMRLGARTERGTSWNLIRKTVSGVYVALTREDAERWKDNSDDIVIELEVDPADFLYHSERGTDATYTRVKVIS